MTTEQTAPRHSEPERKCATCGYTKAAFSTACSEAQRCEEKTLSAWTPATSPRCETCIHYGAEYPDMCGVCPDTETLPDWKPVHPCFASPAAKTAKAKHGSVLQRLKEVCEKATPGPWGFIREKNRWGLREEGEDTYYDMASFGYDTVEDVCRVFDGTDFDFISAARTALPILIEYCKALEKQEQARSIMDKNEIRYDPCCFYQSQQNYKDATVAVEAARARLEELCPK